MSTKTPNAADTQRFLRWRGLRHPCWVWQWVRSFFGTPLQPQDPYRRDLGEEITQFPVVQRALQVQLLRRNLRNPHVTGSVGTMMGL